MEGKMDVIGIDIGFGFTKASNGQEFIIFKSLLGEAVDIKFRSEFSNNTFSSNLHVTIDDQTYFVGDFAEQQSNVRQFTLDQEKLINEFVKILALTVVGRFTDKETPVNVVSGLPVGYYKLNNKRFSQILLGRHKVVYHKPDGTDVTKKIFINKVRMMPQPLGSFFNMMMDGKGKIEHMDLSKQKVGVVDIGFRTTDFTIFDNLQFIERASATMDTGISKSFSVIANKLQEKSGVTVELYRLYKAVQSGIIKMKGQEYNISNIREQVFVQAAESIANDIDRLWTDEWDIDTIILTGGGCMELAKHLQPLIAGHVIPVENKVDSRLNNVQGYYKYGRYIWGESSLSVPAAPAPEAKTKKVA